MLAWHLQQGGLSAESMRAFEKERIPRVQRMGEQEYVRLILPCRTDPSFANLAAQDHMLSSINQIFCAQSY